MNFFQILIILATIQSSVMALSFIVTSKIYMDIKHKKQPMGRIVFGLFGKRSPKAVANFRHICTRGINGTTYVGSEFHRVVSRFIIQGGDIVNRDGTGSTSIYGDFFEDEALDIEHIRPGYLGMANRGPDTNGCQFYVTTVVAKWLDGKHSVFGKVIEGMDVVQTINDVKTDRDNHPVHPVIISNCGEIPTEEFEYYPDDFNIWGWVRSAGLPVISSFCIISLFHYFFRQLNMYC